MATRTRTSFQKRQKELARVEKQRDKAAKRLQRKLEGPKPEEPDDLLVEGGVAAGGDHPGENGDHQGESSAGSEPSAQEESR
jgi:hypothetical protein